MGPQKAANGAQGPEMDPSGRQRAPRDAQSVPRGPPERQYCGLNGPKVAPKTVPERHERNMFDLNPFPLSFFFSPNKGGTTGVGFLLAFYRITFAHQDFPSPPTCIELPRLA